MRLSWGGRRARDDDLHSRTARQRSKRIQKERAEILRLIERLRDNCTRLQASGDPRAAKLKAEMAAALNAQAGPLRELEPSQLLSPERPVAGETGSTGGARTGSAVGVLQRLEERLERLEGHLRPQAVGPPAGSDSNIDRMDYTLAGVIQGDMLSDVLQMISSNSMSGVFTVDSGSTKYTIQFSDGQIVHGEGGGMSGESAFFAAFAATRGRYSFRESAGFAQAKTIEANTQFLILEALRRIDEEGAGEEAG